MSGPSEESAKKVVHEWVSNNPEPNTRHRIRNGSNGMAIMETMVDGDWMSGYGWHDMVAHEEIASLAKEVQRLAVALSEADAALNETAGYIESMQTAERSEP